MIDAKNLSRYTDHYFTNARLACEKAGECRRVMYQVFQRGESLLCGVKQTVELLAGAGPEVEVYGLADGFTAEKILAFEADGAPVDVYAVGERFFRGSVPFTSDIVGYYEGEKFIECAKVGRGYRENGRMRRVK